MGTETNYLEFPNLTKAEFLKEWKATQQHDGYERGHELYSGSLIHVDHLSYSPSKCSSFAEARKLLHNVFVSKGSALVVQVGSPDERPSKLQKLLQAKEDSQSSLKIFAASIAYRTLTQKSKTRGCANCECSFSKKGMSLFWRDSIKVQHRAPTDAELAKLFDSMAFGCEDEFEQRLMAREPMRAWFLRCPVCNSTDFLVTETDRKKAASLASKQAKAVTEYEQAHRVYLEKLKSAKKEQGWAVLAVTPC